MRQSSYLCTPTHTRTAQALENQMVVALQLIFDDKKEGECIINVIPLYE